MGFPRDEGAWVRPVPLPCAVRACRGDGLCLRMLRPAGGSVVAGRGAQPRLGARSALLVSARWRGTGGVRRHAAGQQRGCLRELQHTQHRALG